MLKGLYGVTDSQLLPDDRILFDAVEQALMGGMKVLQYRDKSLDHDKRLRQAAALKVLCHKHQALLIINDDIELAASVEADGVHLGQQDESLTAARERLGDYAIIGISCEGSMEQAQLAVDQGADYIAFGRFFPSRTKPDAKPAELSLLPEARERFQLPIVAIGGITVDNAPQLIEAGTDMIAVVHNLFAAPDILSRARAFSQQFPQD
ncbi:MAG: thiamine phosphate synthase [Endozoicomonas sp.]